MADASQGNRGHARSTIEAFARGAAADVLPVLREAEPQRVLLELARAAELDDGVETCPPVEKLGSFVEGELMPAEQVAIAAHAARCSSCLRWVDANLDDGQARRRAKLDAVTEAVRRMRPRRFADVNEEVRRFWRHTLLYNLFCALAETACSVVVIGAWFWFRYGTVPLWTLAPAVAILSAYLYVSVHRIYEWRDRVLVHRVHHERLSRRGVPGANFADVEDSWRKIVIANVRLGVTSYVAWGVSAALMTGVGSMVPVAFVMGGLANLNTFHRLKNLSINWLTRPPRRAIDSAVHRLRWQYAGAPVLLGGLVLLAFQRPWMFVAVGVAFVAATAAVHVAARLRPDAG